NTLSAYGSTFDAMATRMNGSDGLIKTRTEGIQKTSRLIDTQIDTLNTRLTQIEARYRSQFSSLDTLLGQMQTTSSYLTQQLASLGNMSSSS
ncbi:MAG: flagellar filament capping protein FliD, partial [Candidatus Accumulibacter sp.]|nr:flagellar filament capping protein FliD [Accumulibacter sp.]